jgi:maltooligosyltrehalose synthase
VIAFARRFENLCLVVVVPRFTQRLGFPPLGAVWRDTAVVLPPALRGTQLSCVFTNSGHDSNLPLQVSSAFQTLPVAALFTHHGAA